MAVIRPGVYFAAVQGEGVVMDLVKDRYLGLSAASALVWQGVAAGDSLEEIRAELSHTLPVDPPAAVDALLMDQLAAWRRAELIGDDSRGDETPPESKRAGSPAIVGLDPEALARTSFSMRAFTRLMLARAWSRRSRRRHGLCWILRRVQGMPLPTGSMPSRERAMYRIVRTYHITRRVLSQGKNDCLWRSVALAAALRSIGVDAEVCFGVQKFPFLAHAWVEADGRAMNERPTAIRKYTIIARF